MLSEIQNPNQNKNQEKPSKKEIFFIAVKTFLAIVVVIVLATAIVCGGYLIANYYKVSHNQPSLFEKKVVLTADKIEYQTRETIKVTIRNNFDFPIYYESPCGEFLKIFRYDGDE